MHLPRFSSRREDRALLSLGPGVANRSPHFSGMEIVLELDNGGFHRNSVGILTFLWGKISEMKVYPRSTGGEGGPLPPSKARDQARRHRGYSTPPGIPPPPPGTTSPVTSPRSSLNKKKGPGRVGQVLRVRMVAPPRIELGTRGFSVLCSTI